MPLGAYPAKPHPTKQESAGKESGKVRVSEEFQKKVFDLVAECENMEMVAYLNECLNSKRSELYDSEEKYSSEDEPKD